MTCMVSSCRMKDHSVNRRTPAATGWPAVPLAGNSWTYSVVVAGHSRRGRGFDVLAPVHPELPAADREFGVVDQLADAFAVPDRTAEEPEITVAHVDYVIAQHRYRTRRAPLSFVVGVLDEPRQIRHGDGGMQPHGDCGIIRIALNGIRDTHGDHPGHRLAEAQTRTGHPQLRANLLGGRCSDRLRLLGGVRFHPHGLLNSSRMNGNTSRCEYCPKNTSRCP